MPIFKNTKTTKLLCIPLLIFIIHSCESKNSDTLNGIFSSKGQLPSVSTSPIINITTNSVSAGGTVSSDGNIYLMARGVCWSKLENPTIQNNISDEGNKIGEFTSAISNLESGTHYYIKAYATNAIGTSYGEQLEFRTCKLPELSTISISNLTAKSATCGGVIKLEGTDTVVERGVCWNTSNNPTLSNSHTDDGSGIGSFTSTLIELTPNTKYYVRAYAKNSYGTSYGNEIEFTTKDGLPVLSTTIPTNVSKTSAISGGNIISDGGFPITACGVCYSSSYLPTINESYTNDYNSNSSFVSNIINLNAGTSYYIRAYATNAIGTSYGDQYFFTTIFTNDGLSGVLVDIDGNTYQTLHIGGKEWMIENLRTTKYRDGSNIAYIITSSTWTSYTGGSYCWYNNDIGYKIKYGALYNWYAVNDGRNICPDGWHVPSTSEWSYIENYADPSGINSGLILKSSIDWDGTNIFGLSITPGGRREPNGSYNLIGDYIGLYWTSSTVSSSQALRRQFFSGNNFIQNSWDYFNVGASVRCIKD